MKKEKSFTLIELLVVIATIALLASIILVSLKGAREKAQTAKTLEWARSVKAQLGGDIVGDWNFNEGQGTTILDATGYNNGTLGGTCGITCAPTWTDGVQGLTGKALYFDGGSDYVEVPASASLNSMTKTLTASVWIKTSAGGGHIIDNIYGGFGDGGWFLRLNGGGSPHSLTLEYWQSGAPSATGIVTTGNIINDGEWYHVVGVIDIASNYVKIFINGVEKASAAAPGQIGPYNDAVRIGYGDWAAPSRFFNGIIDEVSIYNRALTAMEIQKHYVEGLKKFQLAAQ